MQRLMGMNRSTRKVAARIKNLLFNNRSKVNLLEAEIKVWKTRFREPGHYYSPFPNLKDIDLRKGDIFGKDYQKSLGGIDFQDQEQFLLLGEFSKYYDPDFFPKEKNSNFRFYYNNQYFCYSDAIFLGAMMRHLRPKRIIEIGSGFSSALMLDINERFLDRRVHLTFIEPYPEDRLEDLVRSSDSCMIIKDFIQNLQLSIFEELEENDILFVDSSHVSKTFSDVNHILFNILPILKKGVVIHFHDIFFPFEYPLEWVHQQRGWNEAYLIRAFLQYNSSFKIELFTSYLETKYRNWFLENMPACLTPHEEWPKDDGTSYYLDTGGQSLYLRKHA